MPLAVAVVIVGVLVLFLFFAFVHEKPPAPADVAIAYETAWDHLDFSMLFDLSGTELRDGMRRDAFIAAKRAAYDDAAQGRLGARLEVDTAVTGHDTSLVVTRVSTPSSSVRNNVLLERRGGGWTVVGYNLRRDADATPTNP
jgi:hypothetical protein